MEQIRAFEDAAGTNVAAGLIPGFVHVYAGEGAVAVGVGAHPAPAHAEPLLA